MIDSDDGFIQPDEYPKAFLVFELYDGNGYHTGADAKIINQTIKKSFLLINYKSTEKLCIDLHDKNILLKCATKRIENGRSGVKFGRFDANQSVILYIMSK